MKESVYTAYEDLPLFLNAETVAKLLGISISSSYELMHEKGFPSLRIGSRLIVPKKKIPRMGRRKDGRQHLKFTRYPKRDAIRDYFPLPNEIFSLGLSTGEIALYAYLMYCEDRKTFQCHPSYKTIGNAVGMSKNTVKKYIDSLIEKQLITAEPTSVYTQKGKKRNGNLLYTVRPIAEALEQYYEQQLIRLHEENRRQAALKKTRRI